MNWFAKSVLAMLFFIPAVMAVPFFLKNFQIRPELTMLWWIVGAAIGIYSWLLFSGKHTFGIPQPAELFIVVLGIVFSAAANILLAQAVSTAPNPGIPIAVVGVNSLVVYLIANPLARVLPRNFTAVEYDPVTIVGIGLIVTGLGIIAAKQ